MLVGYARVSTTQQCLDAQIEELKKEGCEKIFTDTISGTKKDRPGFMNAMAFMRNGQDTLVVCFLDRIGRSMKDLQNIVQVLEHRELKLLVLSDRGLDTSTPMGKMFFQFMAMMAEYQVSLLRENINMGLKKAKARGRNGGRPKVHNDKLLDDAVHEFNTTDITADGIEDKYPFSRATFFRYKRKREKEQYKGPHHQKGDEGGEASSL